MLACLRSLRLPARWFSGCRHPDCPDALVGHAMTVREPGRVEVGLRQWWPFVT